jgi:LCP family protein required for cell wall assembly
MPQEPYQPAAGPWKRFLIGSALVAGLMAAATASSVILEVNHIKHFFPTNSLGRSVLPVITPAQAGAPETILVIGSDKRARSSVAQDRLSPPHSDTLMLVRMDPAKNQTSLLSIPRDLQVTISPTNGLASTQKINAAYSIGGAALAAKTIEQVMPGIQINHIIDINFAGFRHVIDALGCAYVYVDHRYFHVSAPTAADNYASINIEPGYQKLCDQTALSYARYRHTDSDFVRVARQQDFVRAVKQQVNALSLFNNQDKLLSAFQQSVRTDIHGGDVPHLIELALFSLGRPLRQVHFQSNPGPSFVTATAFQIQRTVGDFLSGNAPATPRINTARRPRRGARSAAALGLLPTPAGDIAVATGAAVGFPLKIYVPRLQSGSGLPDTARRYTLRDESNAPHRAYAISISLGQVGEYYGIEGTDWTSPPILDNPTETQRVGNRTYLFFAEGGKVRVLAWRTPHAVYWINNTLLDSLSNAQMLAVAQSAQAVN